MARTFVATAALLLASADGLAAQIIRPTVMYRPTAWTSVSAGYLRMSKAIHDGPSDSWWNFGEAAQYRASLEMPLGANTSVGLAMTRARMPLIYAGDPAAPNSCVCDADITMQQYLGVLHLGTGTRGFNEALELQVGATRWSDVEQVDGTPLGTGKPVTDFTVGAAYGLGYSFTRSLQLNLMQEYVFVMHKRVAGSPSNTASQQTTRIGLRLALGAW